MIKVTQDGELEIYPKVSTKPTGLYWLFLFPTCGLLGYLCYRLFDSIVALAVVSLVALGWFFWHTINQRHTLQTLNSGMFLVGSGRVCHKAGGRVLKDFTHDGRAASIDIKDDAIYLTLYDDSKKPLVRFSGFEHQQEAAAMLACLQGKKIAVKHANIRMRSSSYSR